VARYGLADAVAAVGSDDLQLAGGVLGGMGIGSWRRQSRAAKGFDGGEVARIGHPAEGLRLQGERGERDRLPAA